MGFDVLSMRCAYFSDGPTKLTMTRAEEISFGYSGRFVVDI